MVGDVKKNNYIVLALAACEIRRGDAKRDVMKQKQDKESSVRRRQK